MNEHTAEKDAPRCECCDARLVNGECPAKGIGLNGDECAACDTSPGGSD